MHFTVGFLLLFLNLFLPGLLFLRFYYRGEFSKEFTTRSPLTKTAFYSLFPGLIIQVIALSVYHPWTESFTISDSLELLSELLDKKSKFSNSAQSFLDSKLVTYAFYTVGAAVAGAMAGSFLQFLVINLKLDISIKLLRFRNQWYYIFSGDILLFPKFKRHDELYDSPLDKKRKRVSFPAVDILVKPEHGISKYQGVVADYDLASDITKIERLYLRGARKQDAENSESWTIIPGKYLIIPGDSILNLNVNYYFEERKKSAWATALKITYQIIAFAGIIYSFLTIMFEIWQLPFVKKWTSDPQTQFWEKLLTFVTVWSSLTLGTLRFPKDNKVKLITDILTLLLTSVMIVFTTLVLCH